MLKLDIYGTVVISEISQFLWASVFNVVTLMSGVVAFLIELLRRVKKYEVTLQWYLILIGLCLLIGSFQAWRVEHERAESLLNDKPDLHLAISWIGFSSDEDLSPPPAKKGAYALVVASVTNTGKPSGAFGYQMTVRTGGNTYKAEPM